jgi:hypothetical protein
MSLPDTCTLNLEETQKPQRSICLALDVRREEFISFCRQAEVNSVT